MRRRLFCLAVVLLVVPCFWATSSDAQTTKPIELRLSHPMSPMMSFHVHGFIPFSQQVEKRTNGKVKITIYPAEAMGKAKDHYDMAKQGVVDIAHVVQGWTPGRYPMTSVMELPLDVPSGKVGSRVLWELYPKHLKPEYPGVKVLSLYTTDPGTVLTTKKPVKTPDDLKGMRIRSPGPQQTVMLKELGASPLSLPAPEVYDALQRGIADGLVSPPAALRDYRFQEVTKYFTNGLNLFTIPCALVMNVKAWESLAPDVQKILEEEGTRLSDAIGVAGDQTAVASVEGAKKVGVQIIQPSPAELKEWAARVKPLNERWVAEMEAKGLPGKKIYEDAVQLLRAYSK